MRSSPPHRASRGFTLIELMVVLTISGVLLAVGGGAFKEVMAAQRMRSAAYNIVSDLVLARSEAVKRGANVALEPVTGGWINGWTIKVVSTSEVLVERSKVGTGVTFASSPASVTFDRNGRVPALASAARFALEDGGTQKRCITIDPSGRPKSVSVACPA